MEPAANPLSLRRRLKWLVAIGLLLIATAVFYLVFWHARPIGSGPTNISVRVVSRKDKWFEQPTVLLGLGDSITDGFGAGPGRSYFSRLAAVNPDPELGNGGYSLRTKVGTLTAINDAVSGATSLELEQDFLPRVKVQPVEVRGIVVLTIGGNDVIHNYGRTPPREGAMYGASWEQAQPWIANFRDRLNRILDGIDQKFPGGCEVFVGNIYDPTDGVGDIEHAGLPAWRDGLRVLAAYNAVIKEVCDSRENAHLVDLHTAFLGHGIHCLQFWRSHFRVDDPHYWYFDNLEDPNDRGYDAILRLSLDAMADVYEGR